MTATWKSLNRASWNTYATACYSYDVANDQRPPVACTITKFARPGPGGSIALSNRTSGILAMVRYRTSAPKRARANSVWPKRMRTDDYSPLA